MKMPEPSSGSFEKCPPGNHLAICYEVLDLGTQELTYQGETRHRHQIWIGWETPEELMEDGRPFVIGRRYALSSHENSTLRRDLESWRGRAFTDAEFGPNGTFTIESIIGKACFLNVVHNDVGDKTYANVEAVAPLPKSVKPPKQYNTSVYFSLDPREFDADVFASLSERMQETVARSPEFKALNEQAFNQQIEEAQQHDDVPF